jgi:hypothetical protein
VFLPLGLFGAAADVDGKFPLNLPLGIILSKITMPMSLNNAAE